MSASALSDLQPAVKGSPPRPVTRSRVRGTLIGVFWVAAILATVRYDQPLEALWDRFGDDVPVFWSIATFLTGALNPLTVALGVLLVSMLDRRVRWRLMSVAAVTLVSQDIACEGVKHLFGRLRPDASAEATVFGGPSLAHVSFSFPSGHAMTALALAALFTAFYPRWRWPLVMAGAAVCVARVQLDRHFFSDVLAAGVLGWYMTAFIVHCLERRRRRRFGPADGGAQAAGDS